MSITKRRRKINGKVVTASKYTIRIYDQNRIARDFEGGTDKSGARERERQLKRLVEFKIAGLGLDAELLSFLINCPDPTRQKLVKWGIVDQKYVNARKPLKDHVTDWKNILISRGNTTAHINNFVSKVTRIIKGCDWKLLSDMKKSEVELFLNVRRTKDGVSVETTNHDIQAIKGFARWIVGQGYLSSNPLEGLETRSSECDRRRVRRGYTLKEFITLLCVTMKGPMHHGLTGRARAILYKLAVRTGMRHSELYSLTRNSFDFDCEKPYVELKAKDAKNRKAHIFRIPNWLLDELRDYILELGPNGRAFPMWKKKGASMIREDLVAAGLPVTDRLARTLDFHCLRNSLATMANRAGIPVSMIQEMMRHSKLELTRHYMTIEDDHMEEEEAKLPDFSLETLFAAMDHQMDQNRADNHESKRTTMEDEHSVAV
ncbi:MAG: tyrosine-type recombinase/integrase [Planctomycetaceae bacterium]|nr:tyrosine-type recombinase/integrase [Planctomycetaceae bacterium]